MYNFSAEEVVLLIDLGGRIVHPMSGKLTLKGVL